MTTLNEAVYTRVLLDLFISLLNTVRPYFETRTQDNIVRMILADITEERNNEKRQQSNESKERKKATKERHSLFCYFASFSRCLVISKIMADHSLPMRQGPSNCVVGQTFVKSNQIVTIHTGKHACSSANIPRRAQHKNVMVNFHEFCRLRLKASRWMRAKSRHAKWNQRTTRSASSQKTRRESIFFVLRTSRKFKNGCKPSASQEVTDKKIRPVLKLVLSSNEIDVVRMW